MSKIKITLNGEEFNLDKEKTVFDLLNELNLDLKKIAVEQNYQIISVDSFSDLKINEGDKIEIVHFIGGG